MTARISVIIPTLNEAEYLRDTLLSLAHAENTEAIVVDGDSSDGTDDVANAAQVRLLRGATGRARQMNAGARAATGDVLLFLHADTKLPRQFDRHVRATLDEPGVIAGAFRLHINGAERSLRLIEWGVNLRSRWRQMPYGDQALFVRADTFRQCGGFREMPIMEDFEFSRRLRRAGRIAILPLAVETSARRWHSRGTWTTTCLNQMIILGYHLGVSTKRLSRWYR